MICFNLVTRFTQKLIVLFGREETAYQSVPVNKPSSRVHHGRYVIDLDVRVCELPSASRALIELCESSCFWVLFLSKFCRILYLNLYGPSFMSCSEDSNKESLSSSFCPSTREATFQGGLWSFSIFRQLSFSLRQM